MGNIRNGTEPDWANSRSVPPPLHNEGVTSELIYGSSLLDTVAYNRLESKNCAHDGTQLWREWLAWQSTGPGTSAQMLDENLVDHPD